MRVIIEGKYRRRLRINFILFTIAGRWEETRFRLERELPNAHDLKVRLMSDPVPVDLAAYRNDRGEWWINLGVAGVGLSLGHINPTHSTPLSLPFSATPIKGVEISGEVRADFT